MIKIVINFSYCILTVSEALYNLSILGPFLAFFHWTGIVWHAQEDKYNSLVQIWLAYLSNTCLVCS